MLKYSGADRKAVQAGGNDEYLTSAIGKVVQSKRLA
jgi:hypothetical protein